MLSILSLTGTSLDGQDERSIHIPNGDDHPLQEREEDSQELDHIGLSKAEIRKSNKPIMEKRRRARINTCLNELKSLILDALKKDPSRHSKLEKADILEMTVKHLQAVQRQQLAIAVANDPSVLDKFKGGFSECAQEITRYISRIDGVDGGIRQRLQRHLTNCTSGLNSTTPLTFTAMAGLPMNFGNKPQVLPHTPNQGDMNNNNNSRLIHRLVAARLAAAGDTAGAALLLQGGLSLLARSGAAPPQRHIHPQVFHSQRPPNNPPKISLPVINEGASSSRETLNRVSAFKAVKRPASPPRIIDNPLKQSSAMLPNLPKLVTPTAIRPFPCTDQRKTLVQAQVSLQPVRNPLGDEAPSPLDFSFRSGIKRQMEDTIISPRPLKILKVEEMIPATSTEDAVRPKQSDPVRENSSNSECPTVKEENKGSSENPEADDKDMWRPW